MVHSVLAIIPARGESKGIQGKNLVKLGEYALLEYSIKNAAGSKFIEKVVVSSDDEKILDIAKEYPVDLHKRPKELADDNSPLDAVIREIIKEYDYDIIVLLQPTSPLRTVKTTDTAISEFLKNYDKYDSLVPLCKTSSKTGTIKDGKYVPNYSMGMQRQELSDSYMECGTVFIFKKKVIEGGGFFGQRIYPFVVNDRAEGIDIDDEWDLELAKFYLKKR
jgi:CMP-N,N'-diacetyllegionaminic acid synthase